MADRKFDQLDENVSASATSEATVGCDGHSLSSDSDEDIMELNGPLRYLKSQMESGVAPETVLRNILGPSVQIPQDADEVSLWEAVLELVFRPPPRDPLPDVTSLDDVVSLIKKSNKIIVLSGAGISVSCGIPDFRSPNGLYARLAHEFPELGEPQAMFDIKFFKMDPRPFFKFAKEIFPGKYTPSPCHRFIATLEKKGKLLRNYTQNIDTLEKSAGISKAVYCHGSFITATCTVCKYQVQIKELKETIFKEEVPLCKECVKSRSKELKKKNKSIDSSDEDDDSVGVMKPDIVFFGEGLPDSFHRQLEQDKTEVDLLIVIGSSLKVRPVSLIPDVIPDEIPRVLINRERLQYIKGFDVRLLGYGDTVVNELCNRLGGDWVESVGGAKSTEKVWSPEERIYLFDGGLWPLVQEEPSSSNVADTVECGSHSEGRGRNTETVSDTRNGSVDHRSDEDSVSPLKRRLNESELSTHVMPQSKLLKSDDDLTTSEDPNPH